MTRKISRYARKMRQRAQGEKYNGAEWLNTIQSCRQYTDEPPPGSWVTGNLPAAESMRNLVRSALDQLKAGSIAREESDPFDHLAHAIGVALVRTHETGGDRSAPLEVLGLAKIALGAVKERWQRIGKWGATRIEQVALEEAVDLYEAILLASSPAQMNQAAQTRLRILIEQGWVEPNTTMTAAPRAVD